MSFVLRASSSSLASPSARASIFSGRNSTKITTTKSIIRSTSCSARRHRRHRHHHPHRAFLVVRATSGADDEGAEGGGTDSEVIEAEFTGEEEARKEETTSNREQQQQEQTPGDLLRSQKEAKADEGINIFAGASEEVGLIEWPTAGKAAQTTGVVIVGIVFSAVFLLVVNEVLSTLSGKIFN